MRPDEDWIDYDSCYTGVRVRLLNIIEQIHNIILRDLGDERRRMDTIQHDAELGPSRTPANMVVSGELHKCPGRRTGELDRQVWYDDQQITTQCFVTNQPDLDLQGLDWLNELKLLQQNTHFLAEKSSVTQAKKAK
ncbi:hypothetical protein ACTXT7_007890 [Hymenolepis weldensis]